MGGVLTEGGAGRYNGGPKIADGRRLEMELDFAPMEGITGAQFRRAHRACFSGVDRYYMPFLSPTRDHVWTPRELRNVAPEVNEGVPVVPQLLTRQAGDFLWAAGELAAMGYEEVNLNLGCPSGTVVAKGKGAGMLADPEGLDRFLEEIFAGAPVKISIKTRLGMEDPEEFHRLLEIFSKYPVALLIVHPRVRADYYRHPVRREAFALATERLSCPLCYNGGLVTAEDCARTAAEFPELRGLMVGQGLLANPALARQVRGGPPVRREELREFHDRLYETYLRDFASGRNTVFHMKELWSYLIRMFDGGEKLFKQIKKSQDTVAYEGAVDRIFVTLPLREEADWTR